MPHWKVKAYVHRLLARLPRPHAWNGLLQTFLTRSVRVTAQRSESKLSKCRSHLEDYRRFSPRPRADFTAGDLGTGWSPVTPVGLALCGAREVWTIDVAPM